MAAALASSAAAAGSGLLAANALGGLRWTPDDLLARATEIEGHSDNAAACLNGGLVAVVPGPVAQQVPLPEGLAFIVVIPDARTSTLEARGALPAAVPLVDAAATLSRAVGLTLALCEERLDDLPPLLEDRLHEPHRGPMVPGIDAIRGLVDGRACLGATISGSGPSMLLWAREESAADVAAAAEAALADAGVAARVRPSKCAPVGCRARWTGGSDLRLARAVG